ncbi:hypothetical protein CYY_000058 [Polysphondylium violaceum]|uniref:Uncharacterized protein n=1 Tax=Polysphondylium violaceum TaxID=133409 RepID=A0A8J4Q5G6_9MYCE|nr:hypothetical protein CYY_000058 [Polysphondylium violaceum]
MIKSKCIVVAFDFGTACSGYAFAYTKDSSKTIFVQEKWGGIDANCIKTLSQIVLNDKNEGVAFGYEARDYFNNNPDVEPETRPYFAFFKMHLFDKKNRGQPVKALNCNKTATAQQLISETLKFLKNSALTKLNSSSASSIKVQDIQWVITIPAIWDDSAKQIMRVCADMAGLCSKDDRESLVFVYEPEAGALQCIYERTSGYNVSNGEKFLVMDNGGGTADFIAYQQVEGKKLNAISKSFGGDFGSIYVNANFYQFLENIFGKDLVKSRKDHPQFQFLLDKFESLKRTFNTSSGNGSKPLDLSLSVFGQDEAWMTSKINAYNQQYHTDIKYYSKRDKLMVPHSLFLSFFTPLFNSITDCVKKEIRENPLLKNLNYIFLIGGFNENSFIQEHIKKELEFTGAKFIISKSPVLAVVQGAARFGLNPDTVLKRLQTRSYAIEIEELVKPGMHPGKKLLKRRGVQYCPNVCDVLVSAGQMVGYDEVFTRSYVPISPDQKSVEISIFSSHIPKIQYTTDPGVQFIGELYVSLPDTSEKLEDRRINVSMKFASTEVEVSAVHEKTGASMCASFDFAIDEAESLKRNILHQEKNRLKVQLCVMMDCTGSMGTWMNESKTKMINLTHLLGQTYSGMELNVSFIGYRDIKDVKRFEIVPFTKDIMGLQTRIGQMVADGGDDFAEDIAGALNQAYNLSWGYDSVKLIVHVADAPCHGSKYYNFNVVDREVDEYPGGDPSGLIPERILKNISSKGIDYYFIKINGHTDKMIEIFRNAIDTPQKKIVVQDLGADVSQLLPSLVNFVTNSITRFSENIN